MGPQTVYMTASQPAAAAAAAAAAAVYLSAGQHQGSAFAPRLDLEPETCCSLSSFINQISPSLCNKRTSFFLRLNSTIPPPAHHSSSRAGPVLSGTHHAGLNHQHHHSHPPLPAHLQPAAVFQAHPSQVTAVAPYAYASLNSPGGKAQYQHFWFAE